MKKIIKEMFTSNDEESEFYNDTIEQDVVEFKESSKKRSANVAAIIRIVEPSSFRQSSKIMDEVEKGSAVIIKTIKLDEKETQRLIDVINGSLYSLKGELFELAPNTYLCSPRNIGVEETNVLGE